MLTANTKATVGAGSQNPTDITRASNERHEHVGDPGELVEDRRIELRLFGCKPNVLPLSLVPQKCDIQPRGPVCQRLAGL